MHRLEEDLRPRVEGYFRGKGFRTYHEVHLLERWIDLVAVKEDVVAVELKIRDWRQAVKQALMYQLASDYSFVAMPWETAFTAHRHRWQFERDGVGLLAVRGDDIRVLLEPVPSTRRLPWLTELLRSEDGPVTKRLPTRSVEGFVPASEFDPAGEKGGGEGGGGPLSEGGGFKRPRVAPGSGTPGARGGTRARRARSRRR